MTEKRARNYSIEILRVLAMIGIVILHTQTKTGWIKEQKIGTISWLVSWGIQTVCMLSVNTYMLISGFFLPGARRTVNKIFNLWAVAFFWSLFSMLLGAVLTKERITGTEIINTAFPISTRQYWFLTVYAALYLISPFLDRLVKGMSRKQYRGLILILIVIYSALPTFIPYGGEDGIVGVNGIGGTNIAWFCVIYLISSYLRVFFSIEQLRKNRMKILLVFSSSISVMILFQICMEFFQAKVGFGGSYGTWFLNYASLFNLMASASIFMLFLSFKFECTTKLRRVIAFLSSSTFGVYLIHENPHMRPILWGCVNDLNDAFLFDSNYPVKVVTVSLAIFMVCCLMEQLRKSTFGRIVPKCIRLCEKVDSIIYPIDS